MIEARLPMPPTANNMFFNLKGGGRAKTSFYKDWIKQADMLLLDAYKRAGSPQWHIHTPMQLIIVLGLTSRRRDASNCLKPIEDALCRVLPIPDDRYNDEIKIFRNPQLDGIALVRLQPMEPK